MYNNTINMIKRNKRRVETSGKVLSEISDVAGRDARPRAQERQRRRGSRARGGPPETLCNRK